MEKVVKIWGGLGNQLFQFYLSCYLKKAHPEVSVTFYTSPDGKKLAHGLHDFNVELPLVDFSVFKSKNFCFENQYHYRFVRFLIKTGFLNIRNTLIENGKLSYTSISESSLFDGYWQWYSLVDEVYSDFPLVFDSSRMDQSQRIILERIMQGPSVSLHVRRGDKLHWRNRLRGWQLGRNYYYQSIEIVLGKIHNPTIYIFSDDVQWVREKGWFEDLADVVFVEDFLPNYSASFELFAMSRCQANILANSTFSWWAAYMNSRDEKLVLAPQRWFRFWNKKRTKDLLPKSWILIS